MPESEKQMQGDALTYSYVLIMSILSGYTGLQGNENLNVHAWTVQVFTHTSICFCLNYFNTALFPCA